LFFGKYNTKRLEVSETEEVMLILRQESLRFCDGEYPKIKRIKTLIENKDSLCFGYYQHGLLIGVALSEKLLDGGCLLWYFAMDPREQKKGKGRKFLSDLEYELRVNGVSWIFLNATANSLSFYAYSDYETSMHSSVYEHYKSLWNIVI